MVPKYSPLYRRPRSWNPRPWGYNPRGCTPKMDQDQGSDQERRHRSAPRHAGPPALPSRPQRQTQPDTGPRSESPHSGGSPARPCRDMQKPRRTGKTVPKVPQRSKRATAETRCSRSRAPVSHRHSAMGASARRKSPVAQRNSRCLGRTMPAYPSEGTQRMNTVRRNRPYVPVHPSGVARIRSLDRGLLHTGSPAGAVWRKASISPGGADAALDKMGLPTAPPPERLVQSLSKGL